MTRSLTPPVRPKYSAICHPSTKRRQRAALSLIMLVQGYIAGIVLAFLLKAIAVSTQFGRDLLSTLTSMFNSLPAIALLPLALLWFGPGQGSLIFVLIHSVLWPRWR